MSEPGPADERWLGEGGHPAPAHPHAWWRREIATADEPRLADLWPLAVEQFGEHEASRLWQEALSSSDASDT